MMSLRLRGIRRLHRQLSYRLNHSSSKNCYKTTTKMQSTPHVLSSLTKITQNNFSRKTNKTRSQAVAMIADRTASQHIWGHVMSFDSPYTISY